MKTKKNKPGILYVVPCVDVEGHLTDENLTDLYNDWATIDKSLKVIFSSDYRNLYPDKLNGHLVFSWFILDFTGFKTNPRKRDWGYHKVYDHYIKIFGKKMKKYGDGVYWHYHHPSLSGIGTEWNTDWLSNTEYYNILNRKIIDRLFFPSIFRPGGCIESNDTSKWLEQWIPFDYTNRNSRNTKWDRLEADGRPIKEVADWRQAQDDWSAYHPSRENYQLKGNMKRLIMRSLDIKSGAHILTQDEVDDAFVRADFGKPTILSFFCHDFREMADLNNSVLEMIESSSIKFKEVVWKHANALDAAKGIMNYTDNTKPKFSLKIENNNLHVTSDKNLFGPQPYLAIKYEDGTFIHDDFNPDGKNKWSYELKNRAQLIGIAANDDFGNTSVVLCKYSPSEGLKFLKSN